MNALVAMLPHVAGLAVLLGLSAFFSGSETAIFSLSRADARRMSEEGGPGGRAVTGLLRDPQRLLSTLLVGNMVVNVMLASVIASIARRLLAGNGVPVAIGISTFLLLVFGEVTPKTVAVHHHRQWARLAAIPLGWFSTLISPVRYVLRALTGLLLKASGQKQVAGWGTLTRDEMLAVLHVGQKTGVTTAPEHELVDHILHWEEVAAHDIMVPRTEVVGVSDRLTVAEAFAQACSCRHSRLPVYHENLDDIWGLVLLTDLARWRGTATMGRPLADLRPESGFVRKVAGDSPVYPVHLVPESAGLELLLARMQELRAQLVVIVDEYGGTAGILTLDDVLEEIIGQISPSDEAMARTFVTDGDSMLVDGRMHIREFNREAGLALPKNGADTVGGYVMELLGRLPRAGDTAADETCRFRVIKMAGRRIGAVKVWRDSPAPDTDEDE